MTQDEYQLMKLIDTSIVIISGTIEGFTGMPSLPNLKKSIIKPLEFKKIPELMVLLEGINSTRIIIGGIKLKKPYTNCLGLSY